MAKFFGTYARLFLGFSPAISALVTEFASKKTTEQTPILPITILRENQVQEAYADPRSEPLRKLVSAAYVAERAADIHLISGQEDVSKQKIYIEEALETMKEKRRVAEITDKAKIDSTVNTLNHHYKNLNNMDNAANYNDRQINNLEEDFKAATQNIKDDFDNFNTQALKDLHEAVEKVIHDSGLHALPSGEVDNLLRPDSYQEVINRFNDTGANRELTAKEIEKMLSLQAPTFETYYKLKAFLAIRAVYPSRENVGEMLRRFDNVLAKIKQDAQKYTEQREPEIANLSDKIKPIAKNIESNDAGINTIAESSLKTVNEIANNNDLVTLEERIQARVSDISTPEPNTLQF